jgi:hypothetical protein
VFAQQHEVRPAKPPEERAMVPRSAEHPPSISFARSASPHRSLTTKVKRRFSQPASSGGADDAIPKELISRQTGSGDKP